jgi:hypothetical protein
VRQKIGTAMDKIFFDTARKYDFSTVLTDAVVVGGINIVSSFTTYEDMQQRAFK